MKINKLLCILLSLCIVLSLSACQPDSPASSANSSSPSEASIQSSESSKDDISSSISDQIAQREVTDQAGRTVELPESIEKIVSGYYISTSACIALGLTDSLVGIEAKAASRPIYALAAPSLLELPNVGSAKEFDLEGCIALEPDLVILPKRLKDTADTMSQLGIAVILVNPESTEGLLEMTELIANVVDAPDMAAAIHSKYDEISSKTSELLSGVAEKPTVYMGANSSYLSTAAKDMYQGKLIELAGGQNAAAIEGDGWTEISYEQLLALDPDIIVIPSEASYTKEDILQDEQLSSLKALQNQQIYTMPSAFEAWDSPTISGALGLLWLTHVQHPELYAEDELKTDAADFYRDIYKIDIDTELIIK